MAPKKGGKGKKHKEPKQPKPTKTQWLARLAERNAVLAASRKKIKGIEDLYFASEKRYEQAQEDVADILQYLQHEIEVNEEESAEYDDTIAIFKDKIKKLDQQYRVIFENMEEQYKETHNELKTKFEAIAAKLSAFEEVRQQREEYIKKREDLSEKMQKLQARHEKELYEAEKAVVIKQDAMNKQMGINLTKLAVDFRQATDVAIGETTNKLIKDNIALGNMLTCMQEIIEKARAAYHKARNMEKNYRCNAELLEKEQSLVQEKQFKQVNIIENLIKSLEEINEKIEFSQHLFKDNRRLQRQIAEKECILKEKKAELHDDLARLAETQDTFKSIKTVFTTLKRTMIRLEIALSEAARTVKEGIDVENITRIKSVEGSEAAEITKEDMEDTIAEYKYKTRETSIDIACDKLTSGLLTDSELQLTTQSSDYNPGSENESSRVALSQLEETVENVNPATVKESSSIKMTDKAI